MEEQIKNKAREAEPPKSLTIAQKWLWIGTSFLATGLLVASLSVIGERYLFIGGILSLCGGVGYLIHFVYLCSFWMREDKAIFLKSLGWFAIVVVIASIPTDFKANITIFLKKMALPPSFENFEWVLLLLLWRILQVLINAGVFIWPCVEGSPIRFIFPQQKDLANKVARIRKFSIPIVLSLSILGLFISLMDFKLNVPLVFWIL